MRLVTAHSHGYLLGHASPYHIPDSGSSEVMEEPARKASRLARLLPALTEVAHPVARCGIGKHPRNDFPTLPLKAEYPGPLCLQHFQEFPVQVDHPAFPALGRARVQPHRR